MNEAAYKLWVKGVPTLTEEQCADLIIRIKLLQLTSTKEHVGKQEFGARVLEALCSTLRKHSVETPSANTLRKSTAYASSTAKMQDLAVFFESISQSKLVQNQILKMAIELLYFDLVQWQGIAISSHTMLQQIHRLPSVLNRNFPGYGQSGLLIKLVKEV